MTHNTKTSDDHTEALQRIQQWCDAYPDDIFIPIDKESMQKADKVLKEIGIDMGAMHAQWARHLIQGIKKIADEVLESEDRFT